MNKEKSLITIATSMQNKWKVLLILLLVSTIGFIGFEFFRASIKETDEQNEEYISNKDKKGNEGNIIALEKLIERKNNQLEALKEESKYLKSFVSDSVYMNLNSSAAYSLFMEYYVEYRDSQDTLKPATVADVFNRYYTSKDFKKVLDSKLPESNNDDYSKLIYVSAYGRIMSVKILGRDKTDLEFLKGVLKDTLPEKEKEYSENVTEFSLRFAQEATYFGNIAIDKDQENYKNADTVLDKQIVDLVSSINTDKSSIASLKSKELKNDIGSIGSLGKKELIIGLGVGIIMALLVGFVWAVLQTKLTSIYALDDILPGAVLGYISAREVSKSESRQIRRLSLEKEDGILPIRIKKLLEKTELKRVVMYSAEDVVAEELESLKLKLESVLEGIKVVSRSDYESLSTFMDCINPDDGVVLIEKIGMTKDKEVYGAIANCEQTGATVLGTVAQL